LYYGNTIHSVSTRAFLPAAPVRRQAAPIRQQVLDGLREAIVSGGLPAGRRITEKELTAMFGVSRTVVREALRQIEAEGLVEIVPNRGPVVRMLKHEEAEDLYRIREVLEGLAARLCAEKASPDSVAALEAALADLVRASKDGNGPSAMDAKNRFYDCLYSGASSEALGTMLSVVRARILQWRAVGMTHPRRTRERLAESLANLRLLVAAIRHGDGNGAETVARAEVCSAAEELRRLIVDRSPSRDRNAAD